MYNVKNVQINAAPEKNIYIMVSSKIISSKISLTDNKKKSSRMTAIRKWYGCVCTSSDSRHHVGRWGHYNYSVYDSLYIWDCRLYISDCSLHESPFFAWYIDIIALSALYGHFINVQECFREYSKVHENVTSFAFSRLKQPSHKNQSAGFHRQPKKSDKVLFLKFCYKLFTHQQYNSS